MKVIFLDIDGVLNSVSWFDRRYAERGHPKSLREEQSLDPDAMACLNDIIANTAAKVVVSSTWRIATHFRRDVVDLLAAQGLKGEIIGRTPRLHTSRMRGDEILAWLECQTDHVEGAVILDDDSDMGRLLPWLVQTDNALGLCVPDVKRAVAILNAPPPEVYI